VFREPKTGRGGRAVVAEEALKHLDHLYRVAFHLAKEPADADDLVQETFSRALAASEQFASGTNIKAWLTRILYNFFFDDYRRGKRWFSTEHEIETSLEDRRADPNPGPEGQTLKKELDEQIIAGLRQMPEEFRAVMVLVDIGDLAYDEVAAILVCPVGTVRSRLSRARKLMRQYLSVYVGEKKEQAERK
jgi:RNA polymerase sigma-70 factor (ECF subfamily)